MAPVIGAGKATPPAASDGDPATAAAAAEPPVAPVSPQQQLPTLALEPTGLSIELTIRAVVRPVSPTSESMPPPVKMSADQRRPTTDPSVPIGDPGCDPPPPPAVKTSADERRPTHDLDPGRAPPPAGSVKTLVDQRITTPDPRDPTPVPGNKSPPSQVASQADRSKL
uniref:Uncharacterized protein n=1 Tax=Leersia perrieri TaxID=77586 RepID=A0A0D9WRL5_9ORYZ